jgi:hypothetical protein
MKEDEVDETGDLGRGEREVTQDIVGDLNICSFVRFVLIFKISTECESLLFRKREISDSNLGLEINILV